MADFPTPVGAEITIFLNPNLILVSISLRICFWISLGIISDGKYSSILEMGAVLIAGVFLIIFPGIVGGQVVFSKIYAYTQIWYHQQFPEFIK